MIRGGGRRRRRHGDSVKRGGLDMAVAVDAVLPRPHPSSVRRTRVRRGERGRGRRRGVRGRERGRVLPLDRDVSGFLLLLLSGRGRRGWRGGGRGGVVLPALVENLCVLRDLLGDGFYVVQLPHEVITVDQLAVYVVPSSAAAVVRGRAASAPSAAHLADEFAEEKDALSWMGLGGTWLHGSRTAQRAKVHCGLKWTNGLTDERGCCRRPNALQRRKATETQLIRAVPRHACVLVRLLRLTLGPLSADADSPLFQKHYREIRKGSRPHSWSPPPASFRCHL